MNKINSVGTKHTYTPKQLEMLWHEYKNKRDSNTIVTTDFTSKGEKHITSTVHKPLPYTIIGFCAFIGISKQTYYECYTPNPLYLDIITRIHSECEASLLDGFMAGTTDCRLAGLVMSQYSYKLPAQQQDDSGIAEAINKLDEVLNKITIGSGDTDSKPEETN